MKIPPFIDRTTLTWSRNRLVRIPISEQLKRLYNTSTIDLLISEPSVPLPQEIQKVIMKVRRHFCSSTAIDGVKNLLGTLESYVYEKRLEELPKRMKESWLIVHRHQQEGNLSPREYFFQKTPERLS